MNNVIYIKPLAWWVVSGKHFVNIIVVVVVIIIPVDVEMSRKQGRKRASHREKYRCSSRSSE